MERKIGEIFEYDGEWYQCVEGLYCDDCAFVNDNCEDRERITLREKLTKRPTTGFCNSGKRNDRKSVIFKKLEKVGEPYEYYGHIYQEYHVFEEPIFTENYATIATIRQFGVNSKISIEIKQNEEDMEENKTPLPKEDNALTRTVYAYVNGKVSDKELIRSIKEMSDEYPYDKNGLKPFSLEAAKAGKPVCTRDGRKARIICFDAKGSMPIVALISNGDDENLHRYYNSGSNYVDNDYDLMMLPEKKEGWIIVSKIATIYDSLEDAKKSFDSDKELCICKAEWEE